MSKTFEFFLETKAEPNLLNSVKIKNPLNIKFNILFPFEMS